MPIGLLGIATGAVKIGQKIFGGIKKRQEAKIEKKAAALVDRQNKLASASALFGTPGIVQSSNQDLLSSLKSLIKPDAGLQSISSAGNSLAALKGDNENIQPTAANVALKERVKDSRGGVNPMVLIGAALALLLLIKKR
jgi:hypothetical protein